MTAFWLSMGFVFAAEMGDKTQLVSLAYAARYSARTVIAGVFAATLLVHVGSVALGEAAGMTLSKSAIDLGVGFAFLAFGIWTLRGDRLERDPTERPARFGPFLTVAGAFFIAELGDKTMLATVTLAGQHRQFVPVWLGSTLGMVLADGLAIAVGHVLGSRLPERPIRFGAAALFIITGIVTLARLVASQR